MLQRSRLIRVAGHASAPGFSSGRSPALALRRRLPPVHKYLLQITFGENLFNFIKALCDVEKVMDETLMHIQSTFFQAERPEGRHQ
jgi:hypothetical protein